MVMVGMSVDLDTGGEGMAGGVGVFVSSIFGGMPLPCQRRS